jgi:RNA polymerase sigma-70 factor (ECF subfamily)
MAALVGDPTTPAPSGDEPALLNAGAKQMPMPTTSCAAITGKRKPAEEHRLIGRILAGEQELFQDLLSPHQRRLRSFALAALRDPTDADDVVQEATLKAFLHLQQFRADAGFATWLFAITRNEIAQFRRKRKNVQLLDDLDRSEEGPPRENTQPDRGPSPLDLAERNELLRLLNRYIVRLSPKDRQVLLLREIDELTTEEISTRLGWPPNTVKSRYFRARHRLTRSLPAHLKGSGAKSNMGPSDLRARPCLT